MCKAMASEQRGSSSIAGKALGLPQQQQAPASSAALTAADPQVSASVPGPGLHLLSASLGALQQPGPSAFENAGAAEEASSTPGALTQSSAGPMPTMLSGPSTSGHSQSTGLLLQPSTTSSALSGFSVAAGLQEAMQHMRLQPPAATGLGSTQLQPQQPEVPAASSSAAAPASAPAASADHLQGRIAHSESQSSADIAQLLGQAQQHHAQQQEHGSAPEDGPATVRRLCADCCMRVSCAPCLFVLTVLRCRSPQQEQATSSWCATAPGCSAHTHDHAQGTQAYP